MTKQTKYETTIGLEIHAQLNTESKIFCRCSTKFGAKQNSQTCPICLGLPGSLPVLNEKAVEFAVKLAVALNCNIVDESVFARKNYFYPDLPKGYQISQFEQPLATNGYIKFETENEIQKIGINRIHLEEDAGKSIHYEKWIKEGKTLLDMNRCGVPLVEIVSAPAISSSKEANLFLKQLRQILLYLEICDGNMEQGSLRCDANISVKHSRQTELGVKTELKNLNTFKGVERALEYEKHRQTKILENGGIVTPETLLWDESKKEAISMRSKEAEQDYRYFPEPDLYPLRIDTGWIESIKNRLPELPLQKRNRFIAQYKLSKYAADILTEKKHVAEYFESVAGLVKNTKLACNWVMGVLLHVIKNKNYREKIPISAQSMAELIELIDTNKINSLQAKKVFSELIKSGKPVSTIIKKHGLTQISDDAVLKSIIEDILSANSNEVKNYKQGKKQLIDFFIGCVLKKTRGNANPEHVGQLLRERLA